jgi:hypothetical protein
MDEETKTAAANLAEQLRVAIGAVEDAKTKLHEAEVEQRNWVDEAATFLYERGGYTSGDDVRMLVSFAARNETQDLLDLLEEKE